MFKKRDKVSVCYIKKTPSPLFLYEMSIMISLVSTVPHVFHGTDFLVHENGIVDPSTGEKVTPHDLKKAVRAGVEHWFRARKLVLNAALNSWKLSMWEVV